MTEDDIFEIHNTCFNYLHNLPPNDQIQGWLKHNSVGEVVDAIRRAGQNKTKVENELREGSNERVRKTRQASRGKGKGRRGKMLT